MVVVNNLDEWLNLAALCLASLRHAAGDLRRVTFNTGDQCVRVWVRLVASILRLNDHDLPNDSYQRSFFKISQSPKVFLESISSNSLRDRVRCEFTFFPANLPRVMMATRPTLRTEQAKSQYLWSFGLGNPFCFNSHFISTVVGVDLFVVVSLGKSSGILLEFTIVLRQALSLHRIGLVRSDHMTSINAHIPSSYLHLHLLSIEWFKRL